MIKASIELRQAIVIALLQLLWLALEFLAGLQDHYIFLLPLSGFLSLIIPYFGIRQAIRERKANSDVPLSFRLALLCGLKVAFFMTLLLLPVMLVFHFVINPDFFEDLTSYALKLGLFAEAETAARQFRFRDYLIQRIIIQGITGIVIGLVVSISMTRSES